MSPIFFYFFVSFRYSDLYTHQDPSLLLLHSAGHRDGALSLKLPLLHLFRSLHEKRCPQFFFLLFCFVRYCDLYTHQNPSLLLLHSAGHRDAGLIIKNSLCYICSDRYMGKDVPNFLGLFCFVTFQYIHPSESMVTLGTYC